MKKPILAILSLSTALAAQTVVSPVGYANVEAGSANTFPFSGTAMTFQQVHGDIRGSALPISQISFRRDGMSTSAFPARAVTLDLWMGVTDIATITNTFATNFIGLPIQVVTNKTFNFPDHSTRPLGLPAPFTAVVALDTPYAYAGVLDLLWELRMTNSVPSASFQMDAASGSAAAITTVGSATALGTGCTTANGTMELRWNGSTSATLHTVRWALTGGPSSAQTTFLVGSATNIQFAPLCETVYTTGNYFQVGGTTSSTGALLSPTGVTAPYNMAFVGLTLTAQAVSLDATQTNLPLALSNGLTTTISDVGGPVLCARIFASGNATATTGTLGNNHGIITKFN